MKSGWHQLSEAKILLITNGPETDGLSKRLHFQGAQLVHISALSLSLTEGEHPHADLIVLADDNSRSDELDLCRRVRAQFSAPILVLTRYGDEAATVALYGAGADECVHRSISRALLRAKINAWLNWLQRKSRGLGADGAIRTISALPTPRTKHR